MVRIDETSLGSVVRTAREQDGLSLRQLAEEAGVSPAQLSRIENDDAKRPSPATLVGIGRALHRSPDILLVLAGHFPLDEVRPLFDRTLPQAAAAIGRSARELESLLAETGSLMEDTDAARELRAILARAFLEAIDVPALLPPTSDYRDALLAPTERRRRFSEHRGAGDEAPMLFAQEPESSRDFRALREDWPYLSPARQKRLRLFAEEQRRLSELDRLESPSRERRLDHVRDLEEQVAQLRHELESWRRRSRELEARTAHLEEALARAQAAAEEMRALQALVAELQLELEQQRRRAAVERLVGDEQEELTRGRASELLRDYTHTPAAEREEEDQPEETPPKLRKKRGGR